MPRRIVARVVLAFLAVVAALSAPASAVLHGFAHEHESMEKASHVHVSGADEPQAGDPSSPAVEAMDVDEGHPSLHARYAAQKPGEGTTALPGACWPTIPTAPSESCVCVPTQRIFVYASPQGGSAAQTRAPPPLA